MHLTNIQLETRLTPQDAGVLPDGGDLPAGLLRDGAQQRRRGVCLRPRHHRVLRPVLLCHLLSRQPTQYAAFQYVISLYLLKPTLSLSAV